MAQTHVRGLDSKNVFGAPLDSGVVVAAGDLVYYDNISDNEFKLADADAGVVAGAEYIATHGQTGDGTTGKRLMCVKRAEIYDEDGPFTANSLIYLADDVSSNLITDAARNLTHTRPTTATDVRQVVGYAITTKRAVIDLRAPRELTVPIQITGGTSAWKALDSGNFYGVTLDAQNEIISAFTIVPENLASATVVKASLYVAAEETSGTPTMDITIGSAISGAQHDAVTADATLANQVREGSAADEVFELNIKTGLDATNIIRPGAAIGIKALQDDGGTDISFIFGGFVTYRVWD